MIRIPTIVANSAWNSYVAANAAATVYSIITVDPVPARAVINGTNPADGDTLDINPGSGSVIYEFDDDGSTTGGNIPVTIASTLAGTLENLVVTIQENQSTDVKVWTDGSNLNIETIAAGDGVTLTLSESGNLTINSNTDGNDGALEFDTEQFDISVDGAAATTVDFSSAGFTTASAASDLATYIQITVSPTTVSANGDNRIVIAHSTTGVDSTLEITDASLTTLFEEAFARGETTNHPISDTSSTNHQIRLMHPADPVFFRNDNRPLLDLADNDRTIYREFVAVRDGYNIDTGYNFSSTDKLVQIRGPLTFHNDIRFKGDIIMEGGNAITQKTTVLTVDDKVITLNNGELASGVSGNGIASIIVDRGAFKDVDISWNEGTNPANDPNSQTTLSPTGGFWTIDGSIIGSSHGGKALFVGKNDGASTFGTVIEPEQVSIGDGVNTFGTFNASAGDIQAALTNAVALLSSGGRIYVKRGSYTLNADVNINTDNISIVGEGATTIIDTDANSIVIASSTDTDRFLLQNIALVTDNATAAVKLGGTGISNQCIVTSCWFDESGSPTAGIDVELVNSTDELLTGNISTTTISNL